MNNNMNNTDITNNTTADEKNKGERPLTIKAAASLTVKFIVTAALVYAAAYALNGKMNALIENERANENYEILDHYDGQFQEIYEKRVNADYIFIGTSHFTHGVTPEEFEKSGKKFFNFSLNGSNPSYYVWWYNEVFKANGYVKPKAIIMGVDWFMFDSGWLWRKPDFDYKYLRKTDGKSKEYKGKWYDIDSIYTYVSNKYPFFSARSRFIDLVLPAKKEENTKKERKITPDGFRTDLFYKGYIAWEADYSGNYAGKVGMTYYEKEMESFVSLVNQFMAEGIPVVFVMAPEYLPGRDAPLFDEMSDKINAVAKEKNIPFLNYNRELVSDINTDYTYYSDWGHLSDKGAHAFSKLLYDEVNKILKFE